MVAFVKDTMLNNGKVRESYATLEGAHIDGSGSSSFGLIENNRIWNMELIDANTNRKQFQAFIKCLKLGYWVGLSGIKDIEIIDYILNKEWNENVKALIDKFNLKIDVMNGREYIHS